MYQLGLDGRERLQMMLVGMQRPRRALLAFLVLALTLLLGACGSGSSNQKGEVVITCLGCQADPTAPDLQHFYDVAQHFNKRYAGRYRVKIITSQYAKGGADRLPYYQRLALADDLPDVFGLAPAELVPLEKTGKLMDFAPVLERESAWKRTFYPGAFDALDDAQGHIWAVPQGRDAIGIYYNRKLFQDAGVSAFPQTWDEFDAACQKIKASGKICFAMDGDWVTLLMWVNLIGTQPGGKQFLTSGLGGDDFSSDPIVVSATERLKRWHTDGFVNSDAFSGEYPNADTPFVRGKAAMIANGGWMVPLSIQAKDHAIKGLYNEIGYEPSPGWTADGRGLIIVSGEASWASGTTDARKQEAVTKFLEYADSHREAFQQVLTTATFPATKLDLSPAERKQLDPLTTNLLSQASQVAYTFPHAFIASKGGFEDAWKNLWPAYVKGQMDTHDFLSQLAHQAGSPTG
jgi:raffinose/stachyose/melibiose transport system substrate-binding protein